MNNAIKPYERILERNKQRNEPIDDTYLFFPEYENRRTAMSNMGRHFDYLLEDAELKYDRFGASRSMYSLRHSAIAFRILYGETDLFLLSKVAGAYPTTLNRFYLSHLQPRMMGRSLQSFKPKKVK